MARELRLEDVQPASWEDGVAWAWEADEPFVTPPVSGWTLVAGVPAVWLEDREERLAQVARLSERFGEAQYFSTHRVVGFCVWVRARAGAIERAYGWSGEQGLAFLDRGEETELEQELDLLLLAEGSEATGEETGLESPDEETVMQIARAWGFCPADLDDRSAPPGLGWAGTWPRVPPGAATPGGGA